MMQKVSGIVNFFFLPKAPFVNLLLLHFFVYLCNKVDKEGLCYFSVSRLDYFLHKSDFGCN